MDFRRRLSPSTKGLNCARFLIYSGIDSRGRITFDKKRKILPREMAANVEVSSEVKMYPIIMPTKVKNVIHKSKITAVWPREESTCAWKK